MPVMIKNRVGILLPNTPVMADLIPRLPNETPISPVFTHLILADKDGYAIADTDEYAIEVRKPFYS